jgi:hypothetical protein
MSAPLPLPLRDLGAALLEQVIIAKTSLVVNGMGQIGSAGTFI